MPPLEMHSPYQEGLKEAIPLVGPDSSVESGRP